MQTTHINHIRPTDQAVLDELRLQNGLTVTQLTERLGVTATAVRQRLERLVQLELVARHKHHAGRGRPQFQYSLTRLGSRYASVSYAELASALWQELSELPQAQRAALMQRVAERMGDGLRTAVPVDGDLGTRLAALVESLIRKQVPATVNWDGDLPVLELLACPYPDLTSHDDSRRLCEIEQEVFSQAAGQALQLDCCRLDGHEQCQFRPVPAGEAAPVADHGGGSPAVP